MRIKNHRYMEILLILLAALLFTSPALADGKLLQGTIRTTRYKDPAPIRGSWVKSGRKVRFINADKQPLGRGWLKIGTRTYHLDKAGFRQTGLVQIGNKKYYFSKHGVQKTGLIKVGKVSYYFNPEDFGAGMKAGKQSGRENNTAPEVSESTLEKGKTIRKKSLALKYDEDGNFYDRKGYRIEKTTLKHLLQTALKPVGQTMYVWGGGWSGGAGSTEASTMGLSPRWKAFFKKQGRAYNYRNYRYMSHLGLDCSGYVGWTLYNSFNSVSGHGDYVMLAQRMAATYAGWGWGSYRAAGRVKNFRAGDLMSLGAGHVYLVIGQCSDGSVVLVHSSPKGVMITGTATRSGKKKSKAVKLATKYMKKYFPKWYRKYPDSSRGSSYLTSYSRMRWHLKGDRSVLSDPDGLAKMDAAKVLKVLFEGR